MIYCVSDIHGDYEGYKRLLEEVKFSDEDILYVLGDVIDRGSQSLKILQDMMMRPNVIPIIGNHEYMGIQCLKFLMQEISEDSISSLNEDIIQGLLEWQNVGGQATMEEFHKLSMEEKQDVVDYLEEFSLYEEVSANGNDFVLVHAGLCNFSENRKLEDYQLHELIFRCPEYFRVYYPNKYLVTGHLPTRYIVENTRPDFIFKGKNHIAIDCGVACGGQMGMICLDTGAEYYVSSVVNDETCD